MSNRKVKAEREMVALPLEVEQDMEWKIGMSLPTTRTKEITSPPTTGIDSRLDENAAIPASPEKKKSKRRWFSKKDNGWRSSGKECKGIVRHRAEDEVFVCSNAAVGNKHKPTKLSLFTTCVGCTAGSKTKELPYVMTKTPNKEAHENRAKHEEQLGDLKEVQHDESSAGTSLVEKISEDAESEIKTAVLLEGKDIKKKSIKRGIKKFCRRMGKNKKCSLANAGESSDFVGLGSVPDNLNEIGLQGNSPPVTDFPNDSNIQPPPLSLNGHIGQDKGNEQWPKATLRNSGRQRCRRSNCCQNSVPWHLSPIMESVKEKEIQLCHPLKEQCLYNDDHSYTGSYAKPGLETQDACVTNYRKDPLLEKKYEIWSPANTSSLSGESLVKLSVHKREPFGLFCVDTGVCKISVILNPSLYHLEEISWQKSIWAFLKALSNIFTASSEDYNEVPVANPLFYAVKRFECVYSTLKASEFPGFTPPITCGNCAETGKISSTEQATNLVVTFQLLLRTFLRQDYEEETFSKRHLSARERERLPPTAIRKEKSTHFKLWSVIETSDTMLFGCHLSRTHEVDKASLMREERVVRHKRFTLDSTGDIPEIQLINAEMYGCSPRNTLEKQNLFPYFKPVLLQPHTKFINHNVQGKKKSGSILQIERCSVSLPKSVNTVKFDLCEEEESRIMSQQLYHAETGGNCCKRQNLYKVNISKYTKCDATAKGHHFLSSNAKMKAMEIEIESLRTSLRVSKWEKDQMQIANFNLQLENRNLHKRLQEYKLKEKIHCDEGISKTRSENSCNGFHKASKDISEAFDTKDPTSQRTNGNFTLKDNKAPSNQEFGNETVSSYLEAATPRSIAQKSNALLKGIVERPSVAAFLALPEIRGSSAQGRTLDDELTTSPRSAELLPNNRDTPFPFGSSFEEIEKSIEVRTSKAIQEVVEDTTSKQDVLRDISTLDGKMEIYDSIISNLRPETEPLKSQNNLAGNETKTFHEESKPNKGSNNLIQPHTEKAKCNRETRDPAGSSPTSRTPQKMPLPSRRVDQSSCSNFQTNEHCQDADKNEFARTIKTDLSRSYRRERGEAKPMTMEVRRTAKPYPSRVFRRKKAPAGKPSSN